MGSYGHLLVSKRSRRRKSEEDIIQEVKCILEGNGDIFRCVVANLLKDQQNR